MAKKQNDSHGSSHGFGEADWVAPGAAKPDPGAKPSTNLGDWVKRDMEYKESLPQQKFY
jgi:hypothetical protein